MASKPQRAGICVKCGEHRTIHAKGRCKNCYQQDSPPKRRVGYCVDVRCPHVGQPVILVAANNRCGACYRRGLRAAKKKVAGV